MVNICVVEVRKRPITNVICVYIGIIATILNVLFSDNKTNRTISSTLFSYVDRRRCVLAGASIR